MTEDKTRFRVRPQFIVVRLSDDEVLVRSGLFGGQSYLLSDRSGGGVLADVMECLEAGCTKQDLVRLLNVDQVEDVRAAITGLADAQIIERVPEEYRDRIGGPGSQLVAMFGARPSAEMLAAIGSARVLLVGAGATGSRIALQLAGAGVGRLRLADDNKYGGELRLPQPETDKTRAEAVAARLNSQCPGSDIEAVSVTRLEREATGVDLMIVVQDRPVLAELHRINGLCLEIGTRWMMVMIDGPDLYVGPTFIPGQSACYRCFELRLEGNMMEYSAYRNHREQRPTDRSPHQMPDAVHDLVAGLTGYEVYRQLATGHGLTLGRCIRFSLACGSLGHSEVLRLPRCPVCGKTARLEPNRALFFSLSDVIEELNQ